MLEDKKRGQTHSEIDRAFRSGDLEALTYLLGNPLDFPNTIPPMELAIGSSILEYAIYHSPLAFIQTLLELGAKQDYEDHGGFPPLIAALSSGREDILQLLELLHAHGADIQQRGVNDYTPLHYAAAGNDWKGVTFLLAHGADPQAKTRIDDYTTPLEEAEAQGATEAINILRNHAQGH